MEILEKIRAASFFVNMGQLYSSIGLHVKLAAGEEVGMFEYLAPFPRIVVTGGQRSGTTICAAMIASDLGYWFYPEEQIRNHEHWRVRRLFGRTTNFVLQAPALCRHVHKFSAPDVAIVLMRRNIEDIVASEKRIGWFGGIHHAFELRRYGLEEGNIAEAKYRYWEETQRDLIHNPFEVEYESLAAHPMWIPKEERRDFGARQYKRE